MKKIIFSFALFFVALTCGAQTTDPAVLETLKKLNSHYYCLTCDGVQNFECTVDSDLFDHLKMLIQKKYGSADARTVALQKSRIRLTFPAKNDFKLDLDYDPIGDEKFDEGVYQIFKTIEFTFRLGFYPWGSSNLNPFFGGDDFKNHVFKIEKDDKGFSVVSSGDEPVTQLVDNEYRVYEMKTNFRALIRDAKLNYVKGEKGLMVHSVNAEFVGGATMDTQIEYKAVGKYWMPSQIKNHKEKFGLTHSSKEDSVFSFGDYKINEPGK